MSVGRMFRGLNVILLYYEVVWIENDEAVLLILKLDYIGASAALEIDSENLMVRGYSSYCLF